MESFGTMWKRGYARQDKNLRIREEKSPKSRHRVTRPSSQIKNALMQPGISPRVPKPLMQRGVYCLIGCAGCRDGTRRDATIVEKMIDFSLISGEKKRWSEFIASIGDGESATFLVGDSAEIDTIRSIASKINTSQGKDYKYVVEADSTALKVRISTKHPL